MTREIKFRGKTIPDGRWVYGYYVVMENETKTVTRHAIMDLLDKDNQYIKDGETYYISMSVVEAETVGQFTSLHDINGKEIYEGDIVHLDSWAPAALLIIFLEGAFCLANKDREYMGDIHYIHHGGIEQCTILGNIHDNPELLK